MIPFYFSWLQLGVASVLLIFIYHFFRSSGHVSELNKKAVLVTGCDTGFGHELTKRLDKLGVTVFAGCLFPDGDGAEQLKSVCSEKLNILHLDVTRDDHVQQAFSTVKETLGEKKLWAIVNNAGFLRIGLLEWTTMETFKQTLDVNTLGPVRVTKAFLPLLRGSQGRIVFVASVVGNVTFPLMGSYSVSKHATVALANTFRSEVKQFGISVHVIHPAAYITAMCSDSNNNSGLDHGWKNLSRELRSVYGLMCLEQLKTFARNVMYFSLPASKMYQVVDDMEDAVLGRCPKKNYRPGLMGKLSHHLMKLELFHYVVGLTLPKARVATLPANEGIFQYEKNLRR